MFLIFHPFQYFLNCILDRIEIVVPQVHAQLLRQVDDPDKRKRRERLSKAGK